MRRRGILTLLAAAALLAPSPGASAQEGDVIAAYKMLQEGRDLSAIEQFREMAAPSAGRPADEAAAQRLQQYGPRLDGIPVFTAAPTGEDASREDVAAVRSAELRPAVQTIVDMAKGRRIVILNEAHDDPEHRGFARSVLTALRSAGFSKLAVETFNNDEDATFTDMTRLRKSGHPVRTTGAYIGDPVFGDMVRHAMSLGYEPVAYEQTFAQSQKDGSGIEAREEAQATNLAKAMAKDPNARFVIYVGYSHTAKRPLDRDGKAVAWMAARLWGKTGSEPLTIDQTGLGSTTQTRASATLREAARRKGVTEPSILYAEGKPLVFGKWRGVVDLQVIHPVTTLVHGRPMWLTRMGRHAQKPNPTLYPARGRALVQAFLVGEGNDAIPIDQVVLRDESSPWFMLPDKPVRFVVKEVVE